MDDASPFHLGPAKIDQQGQVEPRDFQVVDALRQVLVGEPVDAFDFHKQAIFHHQICRVRADVLALVSHWIGRLGFHPRTAKVEFFHERPFVDLFQEARAEDIAHLVGSADHLLHQRF